MLLTNRARTALATLALSFAVTDAAHSQLTLNANGTAAGLALTTFASGFPQSAICGCGPTGSTSTPDGRVLVADFLGNVYRFDDRDNQTVADALGVNTQFTESGSSPALATSRGVVYLARERQLFSLNNDGSVNALLLGGAQVTSGGLAANPVSGHLYANSNISPGQNLTDIDPAANTFSLHPTGGGVVGAVSADGTTVYVSEFPVVLAIDTATYATVWVSSAFSSGMGVLQRGPRAGDILGYDQTTGNLMLFDRNTGAATVVGTGGPLVGGTAMGVDANNGTLLLSQRDRIVRIAAGPTAFASFTAKLEVSGRRFPGDDQFELKVAFKLGAASNGVDPSVDTLTLTLAGGTANRTLTVPAGTLKRDKQGRYKFEGTIAGVALEIQLRPERADAFELKVDAKHIDLTGIAAPVQVTLTIGDDGGQATAKLDD